MSSDDDDYYRWPHEHPRHRYALNTRIMLTAIISLVFVIIMVVLLHFYARFILKRQARRRQAMLQLGIGVSTTTNTHQSQPPRSSSGLDPSVISSLPVFIYKKRTASGRSEEEDDDTNCVECSVCLSTLEEDEVVKLLPNCKHSFHVQCIDLWLNGHSNCPVCRTDAKPRRSNTTTTTTGSEITTTNEEASNTTATAPPLDSEATAELRSSRLSSFRRMVSRERSMRRVQPCEGVVDHQGGIGDLERQ